MALDYMPVLVNAGTGPGSEVRGANLTGNVLAGFYYPLGTLDPPQPFIQSSGVFSQLPAVNVLYGTDSGIATCLNPNGTHAGGVVYVGGDVNQHLPARWSGGSLDIPPGLSPHPNWRIEAISGDGNIIGGQDFNNRAVIFLGATIPISPQPPVGFGAALSGVNCFSDDGAVLGGFFAAGGGISACYWLGTGSAPGHLVSPLVPNDLMFFLGCDAIGSKFVGQAINSGGGAAEPVHYDRLTNTLIPLPAYDVDGNGPVTAAIAMSRDGNTILGTDASGRGYLYTSLIECQMLAPNYANVMRCLSGDGLVPAGAGINSSPLTAAWFVPSTPPDPTVTRRTLNAGQAWTMVCIPSHDPICDARSRLNPFWRGRSVIR